MARDIETLDIPSQDDVAEETPEQLQQVMKNLMDLKGPNGQALSLGKQELSLLQKILSVGTEKYREEVMWRMMDFVSEDEAKDMVNAYYEARDLGMDTSFNVAYAFALCSVNRRGGFKSNLVATLGDILQHGKWAMNQRKGQDGTGNTRSPIGN